MQYIPVAVLIAVVFVGAFVFRGHPLAAFAGSLAFVISLLVAR